MMQEGSEEVQIQLPLNEDRFRRLRLVVMGSMRYARNFPEHVPMLFEHFQALEQLEVRLRAWSFQDGQVLPLSLDEAKAAIEAMDFFIRQVVTKSTTLTRWHLFAIVTEFLRNYLFSLVKQHTT